MKISPFSGWRYNPEKVSDFAQVIAPPYDVIGPNKLKKLQQSSPYNVVRMDLPQEESGLGKYEVAARYYGDWKKEDVLIQDTKPCLYLYFQTYQLSDGRSFTRKGFFARRKLETFAEGGVKPHEKTFAGPKADRLHLTQATRANLSAIFGLYSDPQNQVGAALEACSQAAPLMAFYEGEQEHRVWKVEDPKVIAALLEPIQNKSVMIADGHHRYETALNYQQLRQKQAGESFTGEEAFNYVLMYFCSLQDPGLVVLPTHRVLAKRSGEDPETVRKKLEAYATISEFSIKQVDAAVQQMEQEGKARPCLGWVHDGKIEVLAFDLEKLRQTPVIQSLPKALQNLDVTVLHDFVFQEVMGISKETQREYGNIHYVKNVPDALTLTAEKNTDGFLMNATQMSQMEAVTEIGATMPQKSTFFYPKIPTGLVFHDLES